MKNSSYRDQARQVVNIQFTIRSLEDALIKARCELATVIMEIDTNLACDGFKQLFSDLPKTDQVVTVRNESPLQIVVRAYGRTVTPLGRPEPLGSPEPEPPSPEKEESAEVPD